jgi:cytochrome c-type biogenesis protein
MGKDEKAGHPKWSRIYKVGVLTAVGLAVVAILCLRHHGNGREFHPERRRVNADPLERLFETGKPVMADFGRGTCIPCRMMMPIVEELSREFKGKAEVLVIDVGDHPELSKRYGIRLIPTQIFFDGAGREVWRHAGFLPKAGCRRRLAELVGKGNRKRQQRPAVLREILEVLTKSIEGGSLVALGAALVWGILSIVLSPCHLASIPLIIGFIDEQRDIPNRRAFGLSLLFAGGILLSIALVGAITAGLGRMLGDIGRWGNYAVSPVFLAMGLHLLEVIPMPWSGPGNVGTRRKGLLAALLLGSAFGLAVGPCTFAYMAPMLGVTFRLAAKNLAYGVLLLLAYGIGHCSVIVLAGTFTERVENFIHWNEKSHGAVILKKICGTLVLLGGLYLIYTAG